MWKGVAELAEIDPAYAPFSAHLPHLNLESDRSSSDCKAPLSAHICDSEYEMTRLPCGRQTHLVPTSEFGGALSAPPPISADRV